MWFKFWSSPVWIRSAVTYRSGPESIRTLTMFWFLYSGYCAVSVADLTHVPLLLTLFWYLLSETNTDYHLFTFKTLYSCIITNKPWTTRRWHHMRSLHHFITLKTETNSLDLFWFCSVLIVDDVAVTFISTPSFTFSFPPEDSLTLITLILLSELNVTLSAIFTVSCFMLLRKFHVSIQQTNSCSCTNS